MKYHLILSGSINDLSQLTLHSHYIYPRQDLLVLTLTCQGHTVEVKNLFFNNFTVSWTLNSGRSCCLERFSSFFAWVDSTSTRTLCTDPLEYRATLGIIWWCKTCVNLSRLPLTFRLCSYDVLFAFASSPFKNLRWKLCITVDSKQPLLGILNFKKVGIHSYACLYEVNPTFVPFSYYR